MRKYMITGIVLFLLSLLLLLLPGICSAANREDLPETITMSREQFMELWEITENSESRLIKLSDILEQQKRNSNELQKLIKEQNVSYQKGKNELTQVQELLKNSNKTIAEQNKSLETLSEQIKKEQSKSELKQKQKALWGFIGGVLVGTIAASR